MKPLLRALARCIACAVIGVVGIAALLFVLLIGDSTLDCHDPQSDPNCVGYEP